jgi:hypothetical protein
MLGISGYNLQCLGLVFIIGVGIYFLYKALKVNNNIIEGLTTKDEEQIKTTMADKTKLIVENLNISEARPNIEDTLTELSEFIKYGKVHTLLNFTRGAMGRRETADTGRSLEFLNTIERSIWESLDFVDKIA